MNDPGAQWAQIGAWVAGALGVAVLVARSLPQLFGPLGRTITEWTDQRRRARSAATEAEMHEVQEQIAGLTAALADLRQKAHIHSEWDRRVYRELLSRGVDIGLPPDLF